MDALTLSMLFSLAITVRYGFSYSASLLFSKVNVGFLRAAMGGKYVKMVGGFWFFIVGAPLAAWWVVQFFFSNTYQLNLNTIISSLQTLSGPQLPIVLLFLAFWGLFSLAYAGGNALYQRNKATKS